MLRCLISDLDPDDNVVGTRCGVSIERTRHWNGLTSVTWSLRRLSCFLDLPRIHRPPCLCLFHDWKRFCCFSLDGGYRSFRSCYEFRSCSLSLYASNTFAVCIVLCIHPQDISALGLILSASFLYFVHSAFIYSTLLSRCFPSSISPSHFAIASTLFPYFITACMITHSIILYAHPT